ncbi:MAG: flavodoxin family protein [Clostridiales bacterium]|jgi:multimeric flavodoxin WrbA|nr:flavodoxin family protein [Clostridiales bacterium]
MKVLLLNGSPREKGCTYTALSEVAAQLEKHGIETEIFSIGNKPIGGCTACYACFKKRGACIFGESDGVNACIEKINNADGLIIGSPVYFASINGNLGSFLDRVFYAKASFAGKPAAAIVSCRRGGSGTAFDRLNKYFTISSMPVVSSQYWNGVHGNTPEEVKQDLEGMQIMRTLADNMAWLLKCIEAGKKAGITLPEPEKRVTYSFIR